jgi:hypothetical protein
VTSFSQVDLSGVTYWFERWRRPSHGLRFCPSLWCGGGGNDGSVSL